MAPVTPDWTLTLLTDSHRAGVIIVQLFYIPGPPLKEEGRVGEGGEGKTYWYMQRVRGFTTMRYMNLRLLTYLLTLRSGSLAWIVSFSTTLGMSMIP